MSNQAVLSCFSMTFLEHERTLFGHFSIYNPGRLAPFSKAKPTPRIRPKTRLKLRPTPCAQKKYLRKKIFSPYSVRPHIEGWVCHCYWH
jgi:hypothetical protein